MNKLRILHLEDGASDALFVSIVLKKHGIDADVVVTPKGDDFLVALAKEPDLILSDNTVPGFSGLAALAIARERFPNIPFIFVSGCNNEALALEKLEAGADDFVGKDHLWKLPSVIRKVLDNSPKKQTRTERYNHAMIRLVAAVQELSLARKLEDIMAIVRCAARELSNADGATFVLRDGDNCHYADENAISPLWKGQRFPMSTCISGWVMLNGQPAVIPDIYNDPRIPADAYRPTFVKSMVMVPIRTKSPIGAIGTYWAEPHAATPEEVEYLQTLANTTSVAMENVQVFAELEQRVRERTAQLELANRDLESFSYSVSHDLSAPLRAVQGFLGLLSEECHDQLNDRAWEHIARIQSEASRMARLIDDLLRLGKLLRVPLRSEAVNISEVAGETISKYRVSDSHREVTFIIEDGLHVTGDSGLLHVVMENLLSNAWKYTSKTENARIEVGSHPASQGFRGVFVRDNGAGFDMAYATRLFAPFQRMHSEQEFTGTGVGLATVQRIIERHGGKIWAEAKRNTGATFYFTLPDQPLKAV